jgi:hypothetical protein
MNEDGEPVFSPIFSETARLQAVDRWARCIGNAWTAEAVGLEQAPGHLPAITNKSLTPFMQ